MNEYGLDVNALNKFIVTGRAGKTAWGERMVAVSRPEFVLERFLVLKGRKFSFATGEDEEATLFIEEGEICIDGITLAAHQVVLIGPRGTKEIEAITRSALYVFRGTAEPSTSDPYGVKRGTSDRREKYWGSIETIVNKGYTGKRIFCRKGSHASLEFHCRKQEAYSVHSGKLLVRLRAGRAEDRFFEMPAGTLIFIPLVLCISEEVLKIPSLLKFPRTTKTATRSWLKMGRRGRCPIWTILDTI